MTLSQRIRRRLRRLPSDERGDEGVSKMLILLLVTVPIILVLVIFGGKIVDEFQVGLCKVGIIDPPEWYIRDTGWGYTKKEWCVKYRLDRDDLSANWQQRYDKYGE